MAHKTLINGTAYEISSGKALIGGTGYGIASGKTLIGGTRYDIPFVKGVEASTLTLGSSVYLNENGNLVEYMVVNQGKPSNSYLYDDSCNGTWLLRKDCYNNQQWHTSANNTYALSTIHSYLNNTFLNLFNADTKNVIKQVKIPYINAGSPGGVGYGTNGLSTKVFLLGGREVGWDSSYDSMPNDGACLGYFNGYNPSRLVAELNGTATNWWLRSPKISSGGYTWVVTSEGYNTYINPINQHGIRPCVIVPSNTLFNQKTLVLIGI